jgi:putative transposase
MIDDHIARYGALIGVRAACCIFGVAERSYRHRCSQRRSVLEHQQHFGPAGDDGCRHCRARIPEPRRQRIHPASMTLEEREAILRILCSERYVDMSAEQVYWSLLDESHYYCSMRSMYRILAANGASRERRRRRRHGRKHAIPRLHATGPNQVWCWDVTALPTTTKGYFFYLYAVIDLFSRKIVGWMIADCESKENAELLITETCLRQGIDRDQLSIHADRGSIQKATNVRDLFVELGVAKSYSRPRVSNDNAYVESFFKTTKYHYDYPLAFATLNAARSWFGGFVNWYNGEHHHSGIAYFCPNQLHDGSWRPLHAIRQRTLDEAYAQHPERFRKRPRVATPPTDVWINPPPEELEADPIESTTANASAEEVMPVS